MCVLATGDDEDAIPDQYDPIDGDDKTVKPVPRVVDAVDRMLGKFSAGEELDIAPTLGSTSSSTYSKLSLVAAVSWVLRRFEAAPLSRNGTAGGERNGAPAGAAVRGIVEEGGGALGAGPETRATSAGAT